MLPSLANRSITDPVANITAGIRSMIAHHGIGAVMAGGRRDARGNYIGYGGAGCSSYDLTEYAAQLRTLWTDEPLPVAAAAPHTVAPGTVPATAPGTVPATH